MAAAAAAPAGRPWRPCRPPRLTAAACPTPGAGVGCPPRPARLRHCGSGCREPPARRAPSSARHRGGSSTQKGGMQGWGRGRRRGRRLRPRDVSGGSRAGPAALSANSGAGREGPCPASQWPASCGEEPRRVPRAGPPVRTGCGDAAGRLASPPPSPGGTGPPGAASTP
jgi:hypothetical protein